MKIDEIKFLIELNLPFRDSFVFLHHFESEMSSLFEVNWWEQDGGVITIASFVMTGEDGGNSYLIEFIIIL